MTDQELKRLGRKELLELLIRQSREIERLRKELATCEAERDSRTLKQTDAGTMAEASLSIHRVLEATDEAAAQYLDNIRRCSMEKQEIYDAVVAEAKQEADRIIAEAVREKNRMLEEAACRLDGITERVDRILSTAETRKDGDGS